MPRSTSRRTSARQSGAGRGAAGSGASGAGAGAGTGTGTAASAATGVTMAAELSSGFGSASVPRTEAELATCPAASAAGTATVIASVRSASSAANAPSAQTTAAASRAHPGGSVTGVTPAGSASRSVTAGSASGPRLRARSVYVSWPPALTGEGPASSVSARFAAGPIRACTVAKLLAVAASGSPALTVAVLVSSVAALPPATSASTRTAAVPPFSSDGNVQESTRAEIEHAPVPAVTVAAGLTSAAGSGSRIVTFVAREGPWLPASSTNATRPPSTGRAGSRRLVSATSASERTSRSADADSSPGAASAV